MDDGAVRPSRGSLAIVACLAAGLAGLALLTVTVQNSDVFGRWHDTILIANVLGALTLLAVLSLNLVRLLRDLRQKVPGARLNLRMLVAFAAIAAGPVLVVFLVSVQFLHSGIRTWADQRIAQGLEH